MKEARRRKTRNQQKRELTRSACMVFALLMLWGMVFTMAVQAWSGHPAEQPVNGYDYLISIGGDPYGHPQI